MIAAHRPWVVLHQEAPDLGPFPSLLLDALLRIPQHVNGYHKGRVDEVFGLGLPRTRKTVDIGNVGEVKDFER
jgi:hypothetical protein